MTNKKVKLRALLLIYYSYQKISIISLLLFLNKIVSVKSITPVIIKNAPASLVIVRLANGLKTTRMPITAISMPLTRVTSQESSSPFFNHTA